jgi:hypothetical protein
MKLIKNVGYQEVLSGDRKILGQTHQNNGFDCRSFFWIGIFDFRLKVLEKR